jgi:DNA-directed RNA polymerase subunit RPC12/RpoP
MSAMAETFRCMFCGHEYQEEVEMGEDKERSCPKCRSNSIRHMRGEALPAKGVPPSAQDSQGPRSHEDG